MPVSFLPGESSIGVGSTPPIIEDYVSVRENAYYSRHIHGPTESNNKRTILIVIISAIIFVTMISIYDIFRNIITNYYAREALENPNSHNSEEDIERALIANKENLNASIVFSIFCIVMAIILIVIIYNFL